MGVNHEAFLRGDVYIDYPYETVKFRFEKSSGRIYRRFYGEPELEVPQGSRLFADARLDGKEITADRYYEGRER